MKGFSIYVKNDLLEPKHIKNMDAAVWLYLWLLDKMTSINENGVGKVLGNQPVTYSLIHDELGISERTYGRYVSRLKKHGYVDTVRTPHGLIFTVTKASKLFKRSAKSGVSEKKVIRQKVYSDTPKSPTDTPKSPMQYKTIQDNTKTIQTTTNVVAAKPEFGDPKINKILDFWEQQTEMPIKHRLKANRRDAKILLNMYGESKVQQLIVGCGLAMNDRFAPTITDFTQLKNKVNELLVWGKKRHNTGIEVIS